MMVRCIRSLTLSGETLGDRLDNLELSIDVKMHIDHCGRIVSGRQMCIVYYVGSTIRESRVPECICPIGYDSAREDGMKKPKASRNDYEGASWFPVAFRLHPPFYFFYFFQSPGRD